MKIIFDPAKDKINIDSLAFTITNDGVRAISLRHVHNKEMKKYVKK